LILALETAVGGGSIAFLLGAQVLAETNHGATRADQLLQAIEGLLPNAGANLSDISTVAVSTGPGSFTSIRVGIATTLGLCRSLNVELKGIPVLEALAWAAQVDEVTAIVPSGRERFAMQSFRRNVSRVEPITSVISVSLSELAHTIRENPSTQYVLAGNEPDPTPFSNLIGPRANVRVLPQTLALMIGRYSLSLPAGQPMPIYLDR
jgi:tRNA threonylcarbamoyladenosine biosynthesis protein TsaB